MYNFYWLKNLRCHRPYKIPNIFIKTAFAFENKKSQKQTKIAFGTKYDSAVPPKLTQKRSSLCIQSYAVRFNGRARQLLLGKSAFRLPSTVHSLQR